MNQPQPGRTYNRTFGFGAVPALAAHRFGRLCIRPLLLTLSLLTSAPALLTAQSGVSHTADIHDRLRKAAAYLKANDPNSAATEFRAVLSLDPKNPEANANLGVMAFFQHDYQRASQYLRAALAVDPSIAKTQALLGICQRRLGDPSAQALLEKSFPRLKDPKLQIQAGMELAGIYYQQGNLDRTASVMRSLVDLDSDNIEILFMAQRVYSDLADETLNKLAILAPRSARMQQVIAEHLINEGDLKAATGHYRKALEIEPRLPGLHYELAEAILESSPNDPQTQAEAESELQTAVKLDGDSARTECMLARIASRRSDLDGAYAHYSRALALNPREPEAQIGLGRLLATRDKPQEAVKYLRMAVQADPLNGEAHYRLASVCRGLDLKEESEKEFRLFREIKQTRESLKELYRQMHKKPPGQEDQIPDAEP